jgi:hypothetical protein
VTYQIWRAGVHIADVEPGDVIVDPDFVAWMAEGDGFVAEQQPKEVADCMMREGIVPERIQALIELTREIFSTRVCQK